jgi:glycosyltransferase involved in cell wall biosynthesis
MKISIIIPAYNEEERIRDTAEAYARYIQESMDPETTDLWIVVNGSRDRTADIAREIEEQYSFAHSWISSERMGKGGAVMKGFEVAQGDILAFTDADNSTTPPFLRQLIDEVAAGNTDAAIASRWLPDSRQLIPQSLMRRVASRVFNLVVRLLFQLPFSDTQCGAKAFRREAVEAVRDEIRSTGWAFDVALIWRMRRRGFNVAEVPIDWSDNSLSRVRIHKDGPSMLFELLRIRFHRYRP